MEGSDTQQGDIEAATGVRPGRDRVHETTLDALVETREKMLQALTADRIRTGICQAGTVGNRGEQETAGKRAGGTRFAMR